jgi:hypothetical protein
MYRLQSPGVGIDEIDPPNPNPLASVGYCSVYWVDHLVASISMDDIQALSRYRHRTNPRFGAEEIGSVERFFATSFIYWVESLALLRSVPHGLGSLHELKELLEVRHKSLLIIEYRI